MPGQSATPDRERRPHKPGTAASRNSGSGAVCRSRDKHSGTVVGAIDLAKSASGAELHPQLPQGAGEVPGGELRLTAGCQLDARQYAQQFLEQDP